MDNRKILVALDVNNISDALELVGKLDPKLCRLKVGLELYTATGYKVLEQLQKRGFEIFLDLKFFDIPNTVARTCSVVADMGVWMVNVHALGGKAMMAAAAEALSKSSHRPLLTAVTILTSNKQRDLIEVGITGDMQDCVGHLADIARQSGCDGVVCSALEARSLREKMGREFVLVTPGIRPDGAGRDDQNRVVTPVEAIMLGVDYLVIGRPITKAIDPGTALAEIYDAIKNT